MKKMKILLIEDDLSYAKQVQSYITERSDYEVDIVPSCHEFKSLESVDEYKYILFDIFLHDCQDCEDCGTIDEVIQKDKPVIIITSSENVEIFEKCERNRIIDYIIKHDMVRLDYLITKLKILDFLENYGVLLVEGSEDYRKYLYNFFKIYYPYSKLKLASTKDEAVELVSKRNEESIKLVITDYILADNSTGLELVKELRSNYFFDEVAIIALTTKESSDTTKIMSRFLKIGANDFLNKDFKNFAFVCRIDNVVKSLIHYEQMKSYINKDYLTGCYNRRYLFDIGSKLFSSLKRLNRPVSVALIDLDDFKKINDNYGHLAGDLVLKKFAEILQNAIRKNDFVVRYGGEEFVVFLGSCDRFRARDIIEKRVRAVVKSSAVEFEGKKIKFNFSCGICDEAESLEELIKKADKKLYEAKKIKGITVA
jgi:diguanylate cyclase (GGDEF)-like protein